MENKSRKKFRDSVCKTRISSSHLRILRLQLLQSLWCQISPRLCQTPTIQAARLKELAVAHAIALELEAQTQTKCLSSCSRTLIEME